jgi:hypothetical protein
MENKLKYAADEPLETIHQHFDEIGVHFRKMVAFKMSEGDLDAYVESVFTDRIKAEMQSNTGELLLKSKRTDANLCVYASRVWATT